MSDVVITCERCGRTTTDSDKWDPEADTGRIYCDSCWPHRADDGVRKDPRNNADDAYAVFMSMPQSEWLGLVMSLLRGGVLQPAEQIGFDRALADRKAAQG